MSFATALTQGPYCSFHAISHIWLSWGLPETFFHKWTFFWAWARDDCGFALHHSHRRSVWLATSPYSHHRSRRRKQWSIHPRRLSLTSRKVPWAGHPVANPLGPLAIATGMVACINAINGCLHQCHCPGRTLWTPPAKITQSSCASRMGTCWRCILAV